jgi:hypothetical protein
MPSPRTWTAEQDATIRRMCASGSTYAKIGIALGINRNTIIERCRKLRVSPEKHPNRCAVPANGVDLSDDPNRRVLPAGHPVTWGLLMPGVMWPG